LEAVRERLIEDAMEGLRDCAAPERAEELDEEFEGVLARFTMEAISLLVLVMPLHIQSDLRVSSAS
jgi:hypothetical protein